MPPNALGARCRHFLPIHRAPPATDEQIRRFFTDSGWMPFVIGGNMAFFDPERQIVISDTHRGNLILMDDGLLAPIDLRVQALSGSLLDTVTQLCFTPVTVEEW
jgi:hypothetical protein